MEKSYLCCGSASADKLSSELSAIDGSSCKMISLFFHFNVLMLSIQKYELARELLYLPIFSTETYFWNLEAKKV